MKYERDKDDVNLIDILSIFIRYRVLFLTILAVSVSLIFVSIFLQQSSKRNTDRNYVINVSEVHINFTHDALLLFDAEQLREYFIQTSTDPMIILKVLHDLKLQSFAGIDLTKIDTRLKNMLRETFLKSLVVSKPNKYGFDLSLTFIDDFDISYFFNLYLEQINNRIYQLLLPDVNGMIWEFENVTLKEYPFVGIDPKLEQLYKNYTIANRYIQQKTASFIIISEPYIKAQVMSTDELLFDFFSIKRALLFSTTIVILGIILIFILNWISLVRQDEESMEKLRSSFKRNRS